MDFAKNPFTKITSARSKGSKRKSRKPSSSNESLQSIGSNGSDPNNNNKKPRSKKKSKSRSRSRSKSRSILTKEIFVQPDFPDIWSNLRDNKELCDGTIKTVDGSETPVHRGILCGVSPYCHQKFAKNNQHTIPIPYDQKTLDTFLNFAYTGECTPDMDNIRNLLKLSELFETPSIVKICWNYLNRQLKVENCLQIYQISKSFFCSSLHKTIRDYILVHFDELVEDPSFFNMLAEDLEDFFRDDNLNLNSEAKVFEALYKWVEFDSRVRIGKLRNVFESVRFGLMSYRFFTTRVMNWLILSQRQDLREALGEAKAFMSTMETFTGGEIELINPMARPRVPNEVLFVCGGWSAGSPTSFMESYDFRSDRWFLSSHSDTTPRAYHGLISLDGFIYMIGGFDGNDHFSSMRCFDPIKKAWSEKACMYNPRCYVSCCALDGKIYAMGGYNGRTRMNTAESYDPKTNQWTMINPMNRQRSDASACALHDKIYIAGGFNGQEVLSSVEVLDPIDGQWSFIIPMRNARSGVSMVAHRDCLWSIGGFNGFTRLATCEKYDPADPREWLTAPEMTSPRSNFAVAILYDTIFVIGGFNGSTTIPFVEYLDIEAKQWKDAAHMNLNRSALSACVLKGFKNTKDYCYLARIQEILGIGIGNELPEFFQ